MSTTKTIPMISGIIIAFLFSFFLYFQKTCVQFIATHQNLSTLTTQLEKYNATISKNKNKLSALSYFQKNHPLQYQFLNDAHPNNLTLQIMTEKLNQLPLHIIQITHNENKIQSHFTGSFLLFPQLVTLCNQLPFPCEIQSFSIAHTNDWKINFVI